MYPILFELFGFKIYAYGLCIGIGIVLGVAYTTYASKKLLQLNSDLINNLTIYLVVAAVVGGKVFLVLEEPATYFQHPKKLLSGSGFVFYGSLIFCIGVLYFFIKKHKIKPLIFFDIMAITTCIVHACGRVGCFMAGCCYGKPTDGFLGVVYAHPKSTAPLNCSLHPTQLYEAACLFVLMLILVFISSKKKFDGQVFAAYLLLYSAIRFVTEQYRGDEARGFVLGGLLSHSQLISVLIFSCGLLLYFKWRFNRIKV